mmetsp:Transcript_40285/g.54821  ORF Transcript_40285/g.54821 Transcript_40285/m.54821 type:complete len:236 (-) Transcript_40285:448-1155(-)
MMCLRWLDDEISIYLSSTFTCGDTCATALRKRRAASLDMPASVAILSTSSPVISLTSCISSAYPIITEPYLLRFIASTHSEIDPSNLNESMFNFDVSLNSLDTLKLSEEGESSTAVVLLSIGAGSGEGIGGSARLLNEGATDPPPLVPGASKSGTLGRKSFFFSVPGCWTGTGGGATTLKTLLGFAEGLAAPPNRRPASPVGTAEVFSSTDFPQLPRILLNLSRSAWRFLANAPS